MEDINYYAVVPIYILSVLGCLVLVRAWNDESINGSEMNPVFSIMFILMPFINTLFVVAHIILAILVVPALFFEDNHHPIAKSINSLFNFNQ